jgi:hypothetical protein
MPARCSTSVAHAPARGSKHAVVVAFVSSHATAPLSQ